MKSVHQKEIVEKIKTYILFYIHNTRYLCSQEIEVTGGQVKTKRSMEKAYNNLNPYYVGKRAKEEMLQGKHFYYC